MKAGPLTNVYFRSIILENIKCFLGEHFIDFSNNDGRPSHWTVILGNNNTGKTTLLKCLSGVGREVILRNYNNPSRTLDLTSPFSNDLEIGRLEKMIKPSFFSFSGKIQQPDSIFNSLNSWNTPTTTLEFRLSEDIDYGEIDRHVSEKLKKLKIFGYGTSRKFTDKKTNYTSSERYLNNLIDGNELTNPDIWLVDLFTAGQLGQKKANSDLQLIKQILTEGILPDVSGIEIQSEKRGALYDNFVVFKTDYGLIRLKDLSYGYQTMIAWIIDLIRRMVESYPDSINPLSQPAIVLVDEIDLHLHPDWQRKIIAHLTKHFPNTQFIVTAHSPLIVQSAEEVNLVILKKENDRVVVDQPNIRSFRGWTVEEIMTDLMQLEGQTMSNTYLDLMAQFDEALDEDDYKKAQSAYNQLDAILHPQSSQRKLLRLQMSALSQPNVV